MKYHSKTMFLRCVSFFLFAVMTVLLYPVGTLALTVEEESAIAEGSVITNDQQTVQSQPIEGGTEAMVPALGPGEKSLLELQSMKVEDVERPEVVSLQAAMEKQHVNRLYAQEEALNTVMFQNRDGSTTTYIYTVPVKYVLEDGSIKDKSTAITASTAEASYAYAMEQNDVKVYFGNARMSGVKVAHGEYSVTMKPVSSVSAQPIVAAGGNTALYEGVFGEGTAISYETQLSGVKEDIVLYSNVGKNSFSFTLTTDGLTPALIDGVWCLLDARDATLMKLGEILITDSAGNTTLGSMSIQANVKMGNYTLTVTAPQEFLDADTTVYPVYVDPTITINPTFMDDQDVVHQTIIDMGLYKESADAATAIAHPSYHMLKNDFSQIFYKLPDFITDQGRDESIKDMADYNLGKVTLHMYIGAGAACNITAYPASIDLWHFDDVAMCEPNIWGWMAVNTNTSTVAIPTASATAFYGLDITEIVRGWIRYNQGLSTNDYENPASGFLIESDGSAIRQIASTEAGSQVYFTIDRTYNGVGYYYLSSTSNPDETVYLTRDGIGTIGVTNVKVNNSLWLFRYRGDGNYLIQSAFDSTAFLHSNGIGVPPSLHDTNYLWKVYIINGSFILKNLATNQEICYDGESVSMVPPRVNGDEGYDQVKWNGTHVTDIVSFSVSSAAWISTAQGSPLTIEVFPKRTATVNMSDFTFVSSNPSVAIVNTYGELVSMGNEGGMVTITATHNATGLTAQCQVAVGVAVPTGVYTLQNVSSKNYMAVQNASEAEGALIQTQAFDGQAQMMWKFTPTEDGYYTIQSELSGKYLAVTSTSAGASVIQTATLSDLAKWQIDSTVRGNIVIYTKAAGRNLVLDAGTLVTQQTYTDNWTDDEWRIVQYRLPTSGSEIPYEPWLWNDKEFLGDDGVQSNTNCYSYALNSQIQAGDNYIASNNGMQPGEYDCDDGINSWGHTIDELLNAVYDDAEDMGFVFAPIGKYEECPAGTYKVVFVFELFDSAEYEYEGYHWYRQNPDGTWSHKPGRDPVSNRDASNNLIYDPETADRDEAYANYDWFEGYFCISPVNLLFDDTIE